MQAIIIMALKQVGLWLLSSTFRQVLAVVKKWVDEAEKQEGLDKKAFALDNIKEELKSAGIEVLDGVAKDAKGYTLNYINYLIEKYALKYP